jgi:DGQHR domain-containing protein
MLENVEQRENLRGLARAKRRDFETRTVHPKLLEEALADGWSLYKEQKTSVRLRRKKLHGPLLEDRVWSLLYKMSFDHMSSERGSYLPINPKLKDSPRSQIDVLSLDEDVAIAIECKSSEKIGRRPQFQEEIAKLALIREPLSQTIRAQFPCGSKRQIILAMFLSNISLSENDKTRAREANIVLFDQQDLDYYETLVSHVGPAGKYQLLADMIPGKQIPGLAVRVPAIRSKMGGFYCYTFSISPHFLLKISYVSHRSKGKASDVSTYQRMLSKSRLLKIREYIKQSGIFPTNIVLNLESKRVRFERVQQQIDIGAEDSGILGWLDIKPSFKSAWIIDGQHRLFAYSGQEKTVKSRVSVLAFEGLPPSEQARLFIDINAKQKSVKQSLLQELYAELHWDADEPQVRVRAIVSKAIQDLASDSESPFYQRIQSADSGKDPIRCISLTSIYSALEKTGFHVAKEKHGQVIEYGPLWDGENIATLKRTVYVLKNWFGTISDRALNWWDKGAGEGGGLAMNDGVITCINILRSVFQHCETSGQKLLHMNNDEVFECVRAYAAALGDYLASLSEEDRKRFRDLRGIQGQTTRTRRCQKALHDWFPTYNPPGLLKFLEEEKAQTNMKAKEIVDRIEVTLKKTILEELKREIGGEGSEWWTVGIPKNVRLKVTERFEQDDGKRGSKEAYFELIDYRKIALENWGIFEELLGYGKKTESKDKRTAWMAVLNEKRNLVSHISSGVSLSIEDLSQLQEYDQWLCNKIGGQTEEME